MKMWSEIRYPIVMAVLMIFVMSVPAAAAQLADTPWPMFHHDPNHTGLSTGYGPDTSAVNWTFSTGGRICGSAAIGADGTIYIGTRNPGSKLYAIYPNGTKKWHWTASHFIDSTPAVASDGTIYVGSWDKCLYALYPNGTKRWEFCTHHGGFVLTSPVIAPDGTIYIGNHNRKLYAIYPNGTEKWNYCTGCVIQSSPAIGSDGTIYVGSYDKKLYAIHPNGTLKWNYPTGCCIRSSPAIGADGTIYVGSYDKKLYAIYPNATLKWSYTTGGWIVSSPAINADGMIYVGSNDGKLYAIYPDGTPKWSYTTGDRIKSSPAIDAAGTIYVGSKDGYVYAINPNGTLLWKYHTETKILYSSPAIASDGTVYIGNWDGNLYAFGPGTQPPGTSNRPPVLDPVGDKMINETETVMIDLDASDQDGDALTYSYNRTDLFADFDSSTGTGNWTTGYGDSGTYWIDFGVSDGNGGIDNETIRITVLCGDVINITKKVWKDGSGWVDYQQLDSSHNGMDVRFNITVTAGCFNLSGVVINDTMGNRLAFNNSVSWQDDSNTTHAVNWTIGTLNVDASNSTEFNATIVGYGTDYNTATVTATVTNLGIEVQASEDACVKTNAPAGFEVNNTVWGGSAWVDMIDVTMANDTALDTYRFRCEVENTGTIGMDIRSITVWDELPDNLEYADHARLQDHHGVWWTIEPPDLNDPVNNTYGWIIDNWVTISECLQPGQMLVIEYNVTVVNYGPGCNNMTAEGWCNESQTWVDENDSACINVSIPDLNVTLNGGIKVNPDVPYLADYAFGPADHPGKRVQCNNMSTEVQECNGVGVFFPFNVTFNVTNSTTGAEVATCTTTLPRLAGGTSATVWCNCSWYPTAGWNYTINVTADTEDVIIESDETNNTLLRDVTAHILGIKGGSWQSADSNISTLQWHNGTINLLYSTGDSKKMDSTALNVTGTRGIYIANWTESNFPIPVDNNIIRKARLYVYYNWDKTPDRNVSDYFTLKFNDYVLPHDAVYSDVKTPDLPANSSKPITSSSYPYGMVAYDVTHKFKVKAINRANLTSDPGIWDNNVVSMTGMLLIVVYENSAEPERTIWINEGFDMLKAGEYRYSGRPYVGVSTEEATAYAPFMGGNPIPLDGMADLITVVNHPSSDQGQALYLNDKLVDEGFGIWSNVGSTEIGITHTSVTGLLESTNNTAAIRSVDDPEPDGVGIGGDWFEATNAFLIVETGHGSRMSAEPVPPASGKSCYAVGAEFDVLINITPMGIPFMGAEFDLHFDATVLHAETVTYGDFLTRDSASVYTPYSDIDNLNGVVSFAAARQETADGVTSPGTFAIVHFTAMKQNATSELVLNNVFASDNSTPVVTYELEPVNSSIEVCDNHPPVGVARSLFTYNNIAEKGISKAHFDGTTSHDYEPDGDLTLWSWWVDDGTSLIGEQAVHLFKAPIYWQPMGMDPAHGGHYVPANVTLTVTDDGMPLMDNSTTIEVIVWIAGDTTGDGRVNIADTVPFGRQFGKHANVNSDGLLWYDNLEGDQADMNNDEWVNIGDATLLGTAWGHTAW